MKRVRGRGRVRNRRRGCVRKQVWFGPSDPSLIATAGVAAIAEFVDKLDVVGLLDRGIGSIKARDRGASAGELLVGLAQCQLLGGDALVGLDRQRGDVAATELSVVPLLASTTAAGLARRFGPVHLAGLESAVAALSAKAFALLPVRRRAGLEASVTLARAAVEGGCDFAIATKRNKAMWRAYAGIDTDAWIDALDMPGTQVAAVDYAPAGWPAGTRTIVRRVRVEAEQVSTDSRSRRRRTIDPDQLALVLDGVATHAYALSFIVTNITTTEDENGPDLHEVEAWFRRRTDIEDRIREAKLGAALRHLPSGRGASFSVTVRWRRTFPSRDRRPDVAGDAAEDGVLRVHAVGEEERQVGCEVVDVHAAREIGLDVAEPVAR